MHLSQLEGRKAGNQLTYAFLLPLTPLFLLLKRKQAKTYIYECVYKPEDSLWKLALSFYHGYLPQVAGHINKCLPISLHIFFAGVGDSKITQAILGLTIFRPLERLFGSFLVFYPALYPLSLYPLPLLSLKLRSETRASCMLTVFHITEPHT